MFNSAHLADNNISPGIKFYKIDVFVSVFLLLFYFFPTIIVPCIKVAYALSVRVIFVCVCVFFFLYKFWIYALLFNKY